MASGPSASGYPVGAIVAGAYRRTLEQHVEVLRAAGLWMLLSLAVDLLALGGGPGPEPAEPVPSPGEIALTPLLLVGWLGLTAVVVHRVRRLLLDAPLPRLMAPLDRHVVRYVLAELVLGALALLPALLALALLAPIGGVQLAIAAGTAAAVALFARLHQALVSAALGETGLGIDRSWRATAGVWPQVGVALVVCSAPLAMLSAALGGWLIESGAPLSGSALGTLGAFAQAAVLGAFLADSRLRLIGPPQRAVAAS